MSGAFILTNTESETGIEDLLSRWEGGGVINQIGLYIMAGLIFWIIFGGAWLIFLKIRDHGKELKIETANITVRLNKVSISESKE
jgi:hypothetical protein